MKHITVTPAEDDEVIVAGLVEPEGFEADSGVAAGEGAADEPTTASAAVEDPEPAVEPDAEPGGKAEVEPAQARVRPEADAVRSTTLEDLEPTGMPFAQRVVIIAAVVCIIGALIYYFAVMR